MYTLYKSTHYTVRTEFWWKLNNLDILGIVYSFGHYLRTNWNNGHSVEKRRIAEIGVKTTWYIFIKDKTKSIILSLSYSIAYQAFPSQWSCFVQTELHLSTSKSNARPDYYLFSPLLNHLSFLLTTVSTDITSFCYQWGLGHVTDKLCVIGGRRLPSLKGGAAVAEGWWLRRYFANQSLVSFNLLPFFEYMANRIKFLDLILNRMEVIRLKMQRIKWVRTNGLSNM